MFSNATNDDASSAEGVVLAYGSIVLMSLVPIVLGSWRTVRQKSTGSTAHHSKVLVTGSDTPVDSGRHYRHHHNDRASDALPSLATNSADVAPKSGDMLRLAMHAAIIVLFSCLVSRSFSRTFIVLSVKVYAYVLGALALAHSISPICHLLVPSSVPNVPFHVLFIKGKYNPRL